MIAQQLVNGVMLGAIYVMVALAFTLAIGILNFMNFSIPGLFMAGGMATWILIHRGVPWWAAAVVALIVAAAISLAVERLSYRPSNEGDVEVPLVSSLGFLVLLQSLVLATVGSDQQAFPAVLGDLNLRIGGLVIGAAQVLSLAISMVLVIGLTVALKSTSFGRQIRSIAESRETATLLGIDVGAVIPRVFVISAVTAALGGVLFALNYLQVSPFMGENVGFKGVAAMIVGGMGSVWGAVLGGLLIGVAEVLSIRLFGADTVDIAVYGLLLVLLVVRPQGLLGKPPAREKL
ncbi:MAG: branched-chain amino acid ABC transporter permease [Xanthobacteraceae bacterium]|nr:branched-chain amino acid ABC transporter permease [Xanthobacteraceae bacterium]